MDQLPYFEAYRNSYDVIECPFCSGGSTCFYCEGEGDLKQLCLIIVTPNFDLGELDWEADLN